MERVLLERLLPGYASDPEQALEAAGERYGIGPIPLFDPLWYRARYGIPKSQAAFRHYVAHGAAKDCDPHPLFSVRHYLQRAPEAVGNALGHFLQTGGPSGLDCHPLFASAWYWERYPDVRAVGVIPIVHYLQWGAAERRDPNPLFFAAYYLAQIDADSAECNPLLHFVREGERAGLSPHPGFHARGVRRAFKLAPSVSALATYLDMVGAEQPARAGALSAPQAELPIIAAALAREPCAPGAAIDGGARLVAALHLDAECGGDYSLDKLDAIGRDGAVAAEFAAAVARPGAASIRATIAASGVLPARQPCQPEADPDSDLVSRYAARQFAASQRFRLDPSRAGTARSGPLISILLPVHRTPIHLLERAVLSVRCQTYRRWELCIVDDGSSQLGLAAALARLVASDPRIKLQTSRANGGISAASNRALAMATGEHVGLLDHDDMLACDALEQVARALEQQPEADLVYSDECTLDLDDLPVRLFPKPDWSPALLTSFMYTGHFSVYRTALLRELGGFRSAYDFSQDYDLVLRVAERDPVVIHIREILYGWRLTPGSGSVGDKPDARAPNIAALQDAMDRRGWQGTAVPLPMANRALRVLDPAPLVSIIVPSDNPDYIKQTVMSVAAHTSYDRYEIVVVAGDDVIAQCVKLLRPSRVRFVPFNAAFNFSAKCNAGAVAASGEVVLFLNDDVRVLTPDWLQAILEALAFPGTGAVSPKLLYADNTIQHAGMMTGMRRLVATSFHCFGHGTPAFFNLAQSLREVSLLSGACLAFPAPLFRSIGGFDAVNTPIAHSDVDICLRLREAGYRCIYTPHAELTHLGHQAIGAAEENRPFRPDKADIFLLQRWGKQVEDDPYFPLGMRELLAWGDHRPFRLFVASEQPRPLARADALIISHDLSASGAPKIVWDMARVLLEAGRYVLVISREDGPYRDKLLELGADVMIDPDVLEAHAPTIELGRNFDLVIGNTVLCWRLLPKLSRYTQAYLYAHETGLIEQIAATEPEFVPALATAAGLWAAGERPAAVLRRFGLRPAILEGSVQAKAAPSVEVRGLEAVVLILATIEPRKGQDLAIKAFPLLPPAVRARCRLRIHGRVNDVPFTEAIREIVEADERVEIGPELSLEECPAALAAADIVLCPSRDDPLPIVSLDALASGKILIVSQEVGTAAYLRDGISGFILRANVPEQIAATLTRVIAERARWHEIGAAAQQVYREHFSPERFADRLLALVGEVFGAETEAAD